jgi:type IV pilus assembly protein PilC
MASTFVWSGKTRQGQAQKGELVAKTREEVIAQLRKQNILVTSVQEKAARGNSPASAAGSGARTS